MEMAKVADLMAFIASASSPWEENKSNYIDSFGNQCLSVFRTICLPSTTVLIRVSFLLVYIFFKCCDVLSCIVFVFDVFSNESCILCNIIVMNLCYSKCVYQK
ncbi:unnamed protein product, partial [Arabidopsis halleri]